MKTEERSQNQPSRDLTWPPESNTFVNCIGHIGLEWYVHLEKLDTLCCSVQKFSDLLFYSETGWDRVNFLTACLTFLVPVPFSARGNPLEGVAKIRKVIFHL